MVILILLKISMNAWINLVLNTGNVKTPLDLLLAVANRDMKAMEKSALV